MESEAKDLLFGIAGEGNPFAASLLWITLVVFE